MGACLSYRTYKESARDKVAKAFDYDVSRSRSEDGSSYSGEIGMLLGIAAWKDLRLTTEQDAIDYISKHHDKWDGAMAVSFRLPDPKKDKAYRMAEVNAQEVYESVQALVRQINEQFQNRKSLFIGCKKCKSRINMKYVRGTHCPLCSESFLSATIRKRIEKAEAKYREVQQKVKDAQDEMAGNETGWVVGGWCSS